MDLYYHLGVTIDRSLRFHSHIRRIVGAAGGLTTNVLNCTLSRDSDFLINVYKSHVRPILEYASCVWNTGYIGDLKLLERIQRRFTRSIVNMSSHSYEDRLKLLDLYSFKGRLLRADLIMVWKIINKQCSVAFEDIFQYSPVLATRGHPYKLFSNHYNLDVRKRSFSVRVINAWNSLSTGTVTACSLQAFKTGLHRDLGASLYEYC